MSSASFNQVILMGNLGNEPKVLNKPGKPPYVRCSLATNKNWTDKQTGEKREQPNWHTVYFSNSAATTVATYSKKGHKLLVVGEERTRSWQDEHGVTHYETAVHAYSVQLLTYIPRDQLQPEAPLPEDMDQDVPAQDIPMPQAEDTPAF